MFDFSGDFAAVVVLLVLPSSRRFGTLNTATIWISLRRNVKSEDSAVPIQFLSAHNDPVGMDTSMLIP